MFPISPGDYFSFLFLSIWPCVCLLLRSMYLNHPSNLSRIFDCCYGVVWITYFNVLDISFSPDMQLLESSFSSLYIVFFFGSKFAIKSLCNFFVCYAFIKTCLSPHGYTIYRKLCGSQILKAVACCLLQTTLQYCILLLSFDLFCLCFCCCGGLFCFALLFRSWAYLLFFIENIFFFHTTVPTGVSLPSTLHTSPLLQIHSLKI